MDNGELSQVETPKKGAGNHVKIAVVALTALFVVVTYNNCAEQSFQPVVGEPQLVRKIGEDLSKVAGVPLNSAVCRDSSLVYCENEIFSQDKADGVLELDFPCIEIGEVSICARGKQTTHNTAQEVRDCGDFCESKFEYEKYYCHYQLKDSQGGYPLNYSADHIDTAIAGAYANCLSALGH